MPRLFLAELHRASLLGRHVTALAAGARAVPADPAGARLVKSSLFRPPPPLARFGFAGPKPLSEGWAAMTPSAAEWQ